MSNIIFYTAGASPALLHARNYLRAWGYEVVDQPEDRVTHLLLPVPSLDEAGNIRGGGPLTEVLSALPKDVTVFGGMLPPLPCPAVDFLEDAHYTTENAAITAHCAYQLVIQQMEHPISGLPVLIIGWGRIGKCLAQLFREAGAQVTVALRTGADAAIAQALGYWVVISSQCDPKLYNIILNTAPCPILHQNAAAADTLLMDLASVKGLDGNRVLWERGLPGRMAPEASGILIAKTALRYALGKE